MCSDNMYKTLFKSQYNNYDFDVHFFGISYIYILFDLVYILHILALRQNLRQLEFICSTALGTLSKLSFFPPVRGVGIICDCSPFYIDLSVVMYCVPGVWVLWMFICQLLFLLV